MSVLSLAPRRPARLRVPCSAGACAVPRRGAASREGTAGTSPAGSNPARACEKSPTGREVLRNVSADAESRERLRFGVARSPAGRAAWSSRAGRAAAAKGCAAGGWRRVFSPRGRFPATHRARSCPHTRDVVEVQHEALMSVPHEPPHRLLEQDVPITEAQPAIEIEHRNRGHRAFLNRHRLPIQLPGRTRKTGMSDLKVHATSMCDRGRFEVVSS